MGRNLPLKGALVGGHELLLRFGLSDRITPTPSLALAYITSGGLAEFAGLAFTARAQRPMRVSVQLRAPRTDGGEDDRWQRSVYLDTAAAARAVAFAELRPVGANQPPAPPLERVRSILFVVDPVNTRRGTSGRVWISEVALGKRP